VVQWKPVALSSETISVILGQKTNKKIYNTDIKHKNVQFLLLQEDI
jgi:hypothetical protein